VQRDSVTLDDVDCFFSSCSIASTASCKPRGTRCVGVNLALLSSYDHRESSGTHALRNSKPTNQRKSVCQPIT